MNSGKLEIAHVINEINDLQYDLQEWFRGNLDDFKKISSRQATDLTVISSQGLYETRSDFNTRYKALKGKYPDVVLSSETIRTKRLASDTIIVTYKQQSVVDEKTYYRLTSAIFRYNDSLKNKAEWIHVHVTLKQ